MTLDIILALYKADDYSRPATEWEVDQLVMWHITNIFWFCFKCFEYSYNLTILCLLTCTLHTASEAAGPWTWWWRSNCAGALGQIAWTCLRSFESRPSSQPSPSSVQLFQKAVSGDKFGTTRVTNFLLVLSARLILGIKSIYTTENSLQRNEPRHYSYPTCYIVYLWDKA